MREEFIQAEKLNKDQNAVFKSSISYEIYFDFSISFDIFFNSV